MRIANIAAWATAGILSFTGSLAMAEESVAGRPVPDGTGFQRAVTEVAHDIHWLDDFLLVIIAAISLFVTALLAIVVLRYNRKANPTPAKFTHNAMIEVIWTAVPVLILIVIAIPSLRLLFLQLDVPENPDLTIKVTGNQWYWSYEYPDQKISFDALMIGQGATGATPDVVAELEKYGYTADDWLLATDTRMVVPVNAVVHMLVTGADVIHAWTIPSFGSKVDAVPGRLNETWFKAEETGVFFGQCSELCGKDHSFMPIVVEVMTQADYDNWVATKQAELGVTPSTKLAAAE